MKTFRMESSIVQIRPQEGVDFVTDENSNSIGVIRYNPEFTDDGVSKIQYHNLVKSNKENIKSKLESPKNQSSYPNG